MRSNPTAVTCRRRRILRRLHRAAAAAPPAAAVACKSPRCKACDPKTGRCYPNQCAAGYGVTSAGGCQRCADARCSQCTDGGVPYAGGAAVSDARAKTVCQTCTTGWGLNTKTVGTTTKCTPCKVRANPATP